MTSTDTPDAAAEPIRDTTTPPAPPGGEPPAAAERDGSSRVEIFAAILLGLAAVLTAVAAYRAALLDGDALKGYTESTRLDAQATAQDGFGDQIFATDQALFTEFAILAAQEPADLEDAPSQYILDSLARDQLKAAIGWWASQPEDQLPPSPFVAENPVFEDPNYNPGWTEAQNLYAQAEAKFDEGKKADDQGDIFEQAAVFLAGTLFFAGIAIVFKRRELQYTMLVFATVFLVVGGVRVAQAWTA